MVVGIIFIVIAIVGLFSICFQSDGDGPFVLAGFLLGALFILGVIIVCDETIPEKKEFKYPVSEYTLEYEVTTRGEQIDSTYVITKLE